jgi:putative ABC transport system permease protein
MTLSFAADMAHGWRLLVKQGGPYRIAAITLAVAIAAITTMFCIVRAVLWAPLPYAGADRLALVWDRTGESSRNIWLSPPEFTDLRARATAFADAAALTDRRYILTGLGGPDELQAAAVSSNVFAMLGVAPIAGRLLRTGDDVHGGRFVAVVSEQVADRVYASAAAAVGQPMTLDGDTWIIVGVLPRTFTFWPPSAVFPRRVDVWVPIDADLYVSAGRNLNMLHALVRLRDGASFRSAAADLDRVSQGITRDHPESYGTERWRMALVPLQEQLVGGVRPALEILLGAVALLLLIACANVANLLLARGGARGQEMAVRAALGASRARLLGQLLAESVALAVVGAAAGVLLAAWAVAWIAHAGPGDVPRLETAALDGRVLLFTAAIAAMSALLFGSAPALQLSRFDTPARLKEGLRGATAGPRARRLRNAFVVTQIALAVALTVGTGLLLKGLIRLEHVDSGFTADALATGRVRLPLSKYPGAAERAAFFEALTQRLAERQDLTASGAVTQLPMSAAFLGSTFEVPAGERRDAAVSFGADLRGVTPGYFDALGIRLVAGRRLAAGDTRESRGVAVIDETLAHRFWPDGSAVGRRLRWVRTNEMIEIVGIVAAVRHYGVAAPARETVYRPYSQYASIPEMYVEARSPRGYETARGAIAEEVRRLDADQPVADLRRVETLVEASLGQPRFNTLLLTVFAAIATLLATVGIYGVMSFDTAQRTQEIGVRMAIGADATSVVRLMIRAGAAMTFAGVAAGAVLAALCGRLLQSMLFGADPLDPAVFASVTTLVTVVALLACYLPARRAARLDPSAALRRHQL